MCYAACEDFAMPTKTRTITIAFTLLAVVVLLSVALYLNEGTREFLTSPTALREQVEGFGVFAPLVVVAYHVLQVVFAPVPGQPVDVASGYLFGPYLGSITALIGIYLGSFFAILLAREFGRPVVEHLVSEAGVRKMDRYLDRRSMWFFILLFLLPVSPGDLLCFALGLTRVSLWKTMGVVLLGRTPVVITAVLVGYTGSHLSPLEFVAIAAVVIVALLLMLQFIPHRQLRRFRFWD